MWNCFFVHYKEKGISLQVRIQPISNLEIECSYNFIFNYIFIEKGNITKTNEILKSFNIILIYYKSYIELII